MTTTRTSTVRRGRLARLTRAYPFLQGYAVLPWLLMAVLPLLLDTGIVRGGWSWLVAIGVTLLAAEGSRWIRRWYERTFGLVKPTGGSNWTPFLTYVGLMLAAFVVVPGLLTRFAGVPQVVFDGPVLSWPFAVFGLLLVGTALYAFPLLPFSLVYGALIAALALVPLGEWLGVAGAVHPFSTPFRLVVIALGLIGHAFTAHATLVRELRRVQEELGLPSTSELSDSVNRVGHR